jgi:mannose-6-phosphate isomerase-like protein (cupin superfamily)
MEGRSGSSCSLAEAAVEVAPDGSEIRRLLALRGGSFAHCTLYPGDVSTAVRHRSVEELWYVVKGRGQLWRKRGATEHVVELAPGQCAAIAAGVHFQFRSTGREPLELILCTMPPWPGASEAIRVADHWRPRAERLRRP